MAMVGMGLGSSSSSSSSYSAAVAVDKATSDLLIGPDWTMNMDICDSINSNRWQAKDVVKAVKKRLQHKSSKVHLLALTLLETMVKNCGDYVHFQIAEKNILGEMIKIVRKKTDMHVRDKILVLLDSWQEAFGGPGGKYPQYYWAYEELRRSGVEFPRRSLDTAPIFTPPATHPTLMHAQPGYGMPSNSTRRLDETMAAEIEGLSLSSLDSMRDVMELLNDMLQAVNPGDREAVREEVIVDLVSRCRSNQKKLMQMLTTTGDEELLGRGLELNDSLQILLAKHDAIATGSPLPAQGTSLNPKPSEGSSLAIKPTELRDASSRASTSPTTPVANTARSPIDEEDEEEDDFAQLARRHSKTQSSLSQSASGTSGSLVPVDTSVPTASTSAPCTALALPDPPAPVRTTKDQDMIDLLSLALSTTSTSPHTPHTPPVQHMPQIPVSPSAQGLPNTSQNYNGSQGRVPYNSYVVPWAQPRTHQNQVQPPSQPQLQSQSHKQFQPPSQPQFQPQSHQQFLPPSQSQFQPQPQQQFQHKTQQQLQPGPQQQSVPQPRQHLQPQIQPQLQSQPSQYSSGYPPPPWAATPGYLNNQNHTSAANNMFSTSRTNTTASYTPMQAARPMQQYNSFSSRPSNGSTMNGNPWMSSAPRTPAPLEGQKPFIPSYRLFEDLNVLGNADGRFKMTSSASPSLSGTSGQSMVGGRK